ncbi:MAG: cytochrome c oxidase subunit II [Gemmatimonadales bacterium]
MLFRIAATRRLAFRLASMLAVLGLILAGCSPEHYSQTSLKPLSDFAKIGDDIQMTTFWWALGVFILVEGALVYAIFRFRGKPEDAEPTQIHGNTTVEIIWTAIPALILAAIAVPTVKGIFATAAVPHSEALTVEVIGHQWWWEFRYPDLHITTANELHIPVGQTVATKMGTIDVIHSFWAPRFAGKRDVFPNRETRLWFKAEQAGEYSGQCAEFCGIQHGRMAFRVKAQTPEEFQAWVSHMQTLGAKPAATAAGPVQTATAGATVTPGQGAQPSKPQPPAAPSDPAYAAGEKLFTAKGCVGCHSLNAFNAPSGMIGPNLANVGARTYIGAGTLKNTDENLARWIQNPQLIKQGVLMPNLGVKPDEARSLVAFLRAHQ